MKFVKLTANKSHFKSVEFKSGLNLVIADRTKQSLQTDTRNGVGKTSLFQILDFCLGGTVRASDGLARLNGDSWEFTLAVSFGQDEHVLITRALDDSSSVALEGPLPDLGLADKPTTRIGVRSWTTWLGVQSFGLNEDRPGGTYDPTFRRLIAHFLRFRTDAYINPFETFSKQPPYQVQTDNAFLLGLDWRLAGEWQRWKDRSKALGALGKTDLEEVAERLGDLESRRVRLEAQHRRLAAEVKNFEVLPEYREVERRANQLTASMQRLANEVTMSGRLLDLYREQLSQARDESNLPVEELFREAGVVFGEELRRSLSEIEGFHEHVNRNRRDYLAGEVRRLEASQTELRNEMTRLENQRRRELRLLETHGALEDFAQLQQRLGTLSASIETVGSQIEELRAVRKGKAALKIDQIELQERTALDLDQRMPTVSPIIEDFSTLFDELYNEDAYLTIDVGEAGYQFRTHLPRQGSHGISKMAIFAYDLSVAAAWARTEAGPGFLAHDSVVFDGVDERQVAGAVARAWAAAEDDGFQYVLTINTDALPSEELRRLEVDVDREAVLSLTDADDAGGLFGMRF